MAKRQKTQPQPNRRSLSCTELEWERLKEAAATAGVPATRYLLERALHGNPDSDHTDASGRQNDERRLLELAEEIAKTLGAVKSEKAGDSISMRGEINALFRFALERARKRTDGDKKVDKIMADVMAENVRTGRAGK